MYSSVLPYSPLAKMDMERHIEKLNKFPFYDNDLQRRNTHTSGERKCD